MNFVKISWVSFTDVAADLHDNGFLPPDPSKSFFIFLLDRLIDTLSPAILPSKGHSLVVHFDQRTQKLVETLFCSFQLISGEKLLKNI